MKKFLPLLLCIFGLFSLINTQDTPTTTTNPPTTTTTTPPPTTTTIPPSTTTTTPPTTTTTTPPTTTTTPPTTPTTPSVSSLCDLSFFGSPPDPACNVITDADGLQQYDCAMKDSTPMTASITKMVKAISMAEGSFYEMDFNGSGCNSCTLYLFQKINFGGAFVAYPFSRAKFGMVLAFKAWKVPFTSFKVICK